MDALKGKGDEARGRIIDTAVALFARHGAAQVSLRGLTAEAGVNIAAVNYYFGSRAALEEAVFEDVAIRVNRDRLAALKAVVDAAATEGRSPSLESIIDTFIEPYLGEASGNEGALLAQLILRHREAPTDLTRRLIRTHFDPMAKKYLAVLAQVLPGIDPDELVWRYMFMTSVVVLSATDRSKSNRVSSISSGRLDATDTPALRAAMMRFMVGGLTAPAAPAPGRGRTRPQSRPPDSPKPARVK